MIMTPDIKVVSIDKLKYKQHPNWDPEYFDMYEASYNTQEEVNNEYARYRKKLIQQEKEFVVKQIKKSEEVKESEKLRYQQMEKEAKEAAEKLEKQRKEKEEEEMKQAAGGEQAE